MRRSKTTCRSNPSPGAGNRPHIDRTKMNREQIIENGEPVSDFGSDTVHVAIERLGKWTAIMHFTDGIIHVGGDDQADAFLAELKTLVAKYSL